MKLKEFGGLYFYSKKNINFLKVSLVKILFLIIVIMSMSMTITYNVGKKIGLKDKFDNLPEKEKEILIINIMDTINSFSEEKLVNKMKELNLKFPHIALAQSKLETNCFKSKIFVENNNLFGMKEAKMRVNTAKGTQHSHAYYDNWKESLYDYALYQSKYLSRIKTEQEYFTYLSQSYAEDSSYVTKLKSIIKKEKIKNLF